MIEQTCKLIFEDEKSPLWGFVHSNPHIKVFLQIVQARSFAATQN